MVDSFRRWLRRLRVGPKIDQNMPLPVLDTVTVSAADAALALSRRRSHWLLIGGILAALLVAGAGVVFVAIGGPDSLAGQGEASSGADLAVLGWIAGTLLASILLVAGALVTRRHRLVAAGPRSGEWSAYRYTWYLRRRGRYNEFWVLLADDGDDIFEYRLHTCIRGWRRLRSNAPGVALLLNATSAMVVIWIPGSPRVWTAW